jgi:hypothetical protein
MIHFHKTDEITTGRHDLSDAERAVIALFLPNKLGA